MDDRQRHSNQSERQPSDLQLLLPAGRHPDFDLPELDCCAGMQRDRLLSPRSLCKAMKPLLCKMFPRIVALGLPMSPALHPADPAPFLIAKGDAPYVRYTL